MAVAVEKDSRGSHIAAFQAQLMIQIQGRCGLHSLEALNLLFHALRC